MADEKYVKVLFRFYSNVLEEETAETMWAEGVDETNGIYMLNSIPFYAENLASGDIISAFYDPQEEMLIYKETLEFSGNSTVQVIIMDEAILPNDIIAIFNSLGCETEKFKGQYFVLNVPEDVNYAPVKRKLTELSQQGILDYAEPCLSADHNNQL